MDFLLEYNKILIKAAIKLISILLGVKFVSIREYNKALSINDIKELKRVDLKSSNITTFKINCSDKLINIQQKNKRVKGNREDIKESGPITIKRAVKLKSSA